jgi:FkbM family methyltransferase
MFLLSLGALLLASVFLPSFPGTLAEPAAAWLKLDPYAAAAQIHALTGGGDPQGAAELSRAYLAAHGLVLDGRLPSDMDVLVTRDGRRLTAGGGSGANSRHLATDARAPPRLPRLPSVLLWAAAVTLHSARDPPDMPPGPRLTDAARIYALCGNVARREQAAAAAGSPASATELLAHTYGGTALVQLGKLWLAARALTAGMRLERKGQLEPWDVRVLDTIDADLDALATAPPLPGTHFGSNDTQTYLAQRRGGAQTGPAAAKGPGSSSAAPPSRFVRGTENRGSLLRACLGVLHEVLRRRKRHGGHSFPEHYDAYLDGPRLLLRGGPVRSNFTLETLPAQKTASPQQKQERSSSSSSSASSAELERAALYRWIPPAVQDMGFMTAAVGVPFGVPFKMVLYPPQVDANLSAQLAQTGTWDVAISEHILAAMRDAAAARRSRTRSSTGIFLDIGANIGAYTLLTAAHGHRVIAIEPVRTNIAMLNASLALAALDERGALDPSRVVVRRAALTDRAGAGEVACVETMGGIETNKFNGRVRTDGGEGPCLDTATLQTADEVISRKEWQRVDVGQ